MRIQEDLMDLRLRSVYSRRKRFVSSYGWGIVFEKTGLFGRD